MDSAFYERGLKFSCERCSRCCRHDPGFVFLSRNDLERLVSATGSERDEFVAAYCRDVDIGGRKRLSLREKPNYDCIFWENGGCIVYEHRPFQCRSFPFWPANLSSRVEWDALRSACPGIGKGTLHDKEEIEAWLSGREREPLINRS